MKKIARRVLAAGAMVTLGLAPVPAAASLIGDTVSLSVLFPDSTTVAFSDSAVVGPGFEFVIAGAIGVDVDATGVSVVFGIDDTIPGPFFALLLTDLDLPGAIGGVTLTSDILGMDASRAPFDAHALGLKLDGLTVSPESTLRVDLVPSVGVPAPAAALMLGIGLLGTALARRLRARPR
jgi:hypothetical protein